MSDIDLLRRAAALMRERAQAVDPDGWESLGWESDDALGPLSTGTVRDAQYIASWRPAVALAVADLLDSVVARSGTQHPLDFSEIYIEEIAVAGAYLGEDA